MTDADRLTLWRRIQALRRHGRTEADIAAAVGLDAGRLVDEVARMRQAGWSVAPRAAITVAERQRREAVIAQMWPAGADPGEIAERLDATTAEISGLVARMRQRGVDLPKRRPRSDVEVQMERVERLWGEGASTAEIAANLGISRGATSSLVQRGRRAGRTFAVRRADLAAARREAVAARLAAGKTRDEIARELGITSNAVGRLAAPTQLDRAEHLWAAGATAEQIAAELGTSASRVAALVAEGRRSGRSLADRRSAGGAWDAATKARRATIAARLAAGKTQAEIARELGITARTVRRYAQSIRRDADLGA